MTVEEIINKLQSYPPDMIVVDEFGIAEKDSFRIVEEYYEQVNLKNLKNVLWID